MTEQITLAIGNFLEANNIKLHDVRTDETGNLLSDNSPIINIFDDEDGWRTYLMTEFTTITVILDKDLGDQDPKLQEALDKFLVEYKKVKKQVEKVLSK
jgi:hypothetical protein